MKKQRKLFCQICPLAYSISREKEILKRNIKNIVSGDKYATKKQEEKLPILIKEHKSLIRRKLNNVDLNLQDNKAVNLSISAPKVNKVLIKPRTNFFILEISTEDVVNKKDIKKELLYQKESQKKELVEECANLLIYYIGWFCIQI